MTKVFEPATLRRARILFLMIALPIFAVILFRIRESWLLDTTLRRVKEDQRILTAGIESYYIDHNEFPPMRLLGKIYLAPEKLSGAEISHLSTFEPGRRGLDGLSTPFAYLTNPLIEDPFSPLKPKNPYLYYAQTPRLKYVTREDGYRESYWVGALDWVIISAGPDRDYDADPIKGSGGKTYWDWDYAHSILYDPSNGTRSSGDILRSLYGSPGFHNFSKYQFHKGHVGPKGRD